MIMVKMLLAIFYSGTLNTNASCDGAQTEKEDTIFSAFQVMTSALDLWLTSAGFVPQRIRISRSRKNAGFVAQHCPQILRSQKNVGFVGLHYPQVLRSQNNAGLVALHYPQIPRSQKKGLVAYYIIRKSHGRKKRGICGMTLSANPGSRKKTHRICGTKKL
jgi:hypothetical protein